MKKLGEGLSDKELEDMMKQADIDGDGRINYEGMIIIIIIIMILIMTTLFIVYDINFL